MDAWESVGKTGAREASTSSAEQGRRGVRHALRTPLNQIIGFSELLEEELEDEGQARFVPDVQKIGLAARDLLGLLDELLAEPAAPAREAREAAYAAARGAPVREDAWEAPVVAGRVARVLVVDDDPRNAELLRRQLERRGFAVRTCLSGAEALAAVDAEVPDAVLLDVLMPGMSGMDVLGRLRERHAQADLPVIMATALDDSTDMVDALRRGANDYVTKPLDVPVVLARLQTQLALKQAREQLTKLAEDLEAKNRLIRGTLGRYLTHGIAEALLANPGLGLTKRTVTLLMTDLRGFSQLTDRLAPEQVATVLNDYLGTMTEVVERHQGTIDEFIGDAILVVFGAPVAREDDARRAVACALEMQLALESVNGRLAAAGLPAVEMAVALHTGEAIVGNIGSLKRSKYGVVGSAVNLTARIESNGVGGEVLASAATVQAAGADVVVASERSLNAKGFKDPVRVLEVVGLEGAGLQLPARAEVWVTLAPGWRVQLRHVENKTLVGPEWPGRLLRAALSEAELACDAPLDMYSDWRLVRLDADGAQLPGELYAKVVSTPGPDGGVFLRFTAVSPEWAAWLRARGT